jgi:hypothetical protein
LFTSLELHEGVLSVVEEKVTRLRVVEGGGEKAAESRVGDNRMDCGCCGCC